MAAIVIALAITMQRQWIPRPMAAGIRRDESGAVSIGYIRNDAPHLTFEASSEPHAEVRFGQAKGARRKLSDPEIVTHVAIQLARAEAEIKALPYQDPEQEERAIFGF